MKKNRFGAILACRNGGTRLFGKPLQLLDIDKQVSILDYLVKQIKLAKHIDIICLAVAEGKDNYVFADIAEKNGWEHVFGDVADVLGRVLKAIDKFEIDTVFRGSSESPFLYYELLDRIYEEHLAGDFDFSEFSSLPEGSGYELIKADALKTAHDRGTERHRSELVTSYIFDHQDQFKLNIQKPKENLRRPEVRVTVDYPEDLVFCRRVYKDLKGAERIISIADVVEYWDANEQLRKPLEEIGVDWGHGRLWQ